MKLIDPSFEILTDISDGGIKELKHIERCGRVSYRSEDKITEDGESAKKFVAMLNGGLTVEFTVDRARMFEYLNKSRIGESFNVLLNVMQHDGEVKIDLDSISAEDAEKIVRLLNEALE